LSRLLTSEEQTTFLEQLVKTGSGRRAALAAGLDFDDAKLTSAQVTSFHNAWQVQVQGKEHGRDLRIQQKVALSIGVDKAGLWEAMFKVISQARDKIVDSALYAGLNKDTVRAVQDIKDFIRMFLKDGLFPREMLQELNIQKSNELDKMTVEQLAERLAALAKTNQETLEQRELAANATDTHYEKVKSGPPGSD